MFYKNYMKAFNVVFGLVCLIAGLVLLACVSLYTLYLIPLIIVLILIGLIFVSESKNIGRDGVGMALFWIMFALVLSLVWSWIFRI